jgi:hypothetical protein
LTESIAIEKTRLKQAFDPLILDSCREMIGLLEDRRRAIEAERDRRTLSSMPGMAGAHLHPGSDRNAGVGRNRRNGSR